ncbi:MAG: response regulator [Candidatus Omnitrophota bacterium]
MKAKVKILVVDDESETCELLKMYFERKGYVVTLAESGAEAFERIKEASPDVVLLDRRIPDIDGFEILRGIRGFNKDAQVVMVTGMEEDEQAAAVRDELSIFRYLQKPITMDELIRAIEEAVAFRMHG